jgi:hypothetical protein
MSGFEKIALCAVLTGLSSPAFAGGTNAVPAPVVGVGVGAVVLIGIGYRALKNRFHS